MPDLDALPAIRTKSRNLFPQLLRHGAYHGDGDNLRKSHPGIRYNIRRDPKLALLLQQVLVLLFYFGAFHNPIIPPAP